IEALARGVGFEFVDDVVGGAIPGQYIPAVEKGVRQVLTEGALAGFPIQDVRVTVYDGKHHPVDSKEVAFVSAGRKAFLDALQKASPIVLEPIMRLEITAPASAIGDITGDLATKRARINGNNSLPGQRATLQALVPLAEVSEYQSRLKALTGGQGAYTMELSHYDPAPPAPDGKKKAVPEGHAKPSSYAPQPRSPNRAYGAPIQRPILSKHKRPKHRTDHSTSTKKSAPGGAD